MKCKKCGGEPADKGSPAWEQRTKCKGKRADAEPDLCGAFNSGDAPFVIDDLVFEEAQSPVRTR